MVTRLRSSYWMALWVIISTFIAGCATNQWSSPSSHAPPIPEIPGVARTSPSESNVRRPPPWERASPDSPASERQRPTATNIVQAGPATEEAKTASASPLQLETISEKALTLSVVSVAHAEPQQAVPPAAAQPGSQAIEVVPVPAIPAAAVEAGNAMPLETLVAMAMRNNPSIHEAQAAVCKAAGLYTQVGLKPNPSIGYFGQEIGNDGAAGQHGAYVSQTMVRGNKLQWNRSVLARDLQQLRWRVETQRRKTETDVRIQFYRALAAQQKLAQSRQFRQQAQRAATLTQQRLDAQEGTRPDLLQSEILVEQIDLAIRTSELEFEAAWRQLAAAVGVPELAPATLAGDFDSTETELDIDTGQLLEVIASQSPEIHAANARVARAQANLQRQRIQAIPNINAQAGVGHDDATGDTYANLQLGIPLPIHNKNQGNITAAQAEYAMAIREVRRLRMLLKQRLAGALQRLETARATVDKYEQVILPKAKLSLDLVEAAQAAGEVEFLRVLTARQTRFELALELVSARGRLAQAAAEIDGLLLVGSLESDLSYDGSDGLRGQALSGQ